MSASTSLAGRSRTDSDVAARGRTKRLGAPGALTGIRVVALEQAVAAPLCTRHLADLGADVIKIERPDGGDFARRYDSVVHGESAYFVWLNRGKRSAVLNLRSEEGRTSLAGLISTADVFVHNLGPGAIERLGFGWTRVTAEWPRLIDCALSGFGQDGPYRNRKAFDLLLQGESGLISVTGSESEPAKVGISIADISAGMYALASILAALHERERTGRGCFLDVGMLDCLAEWMTVPALYERYVGAAPPRSGLHHATIAPYGPFRASDGKVVLVAVQNEEQWRRLCEVVLLRPELVGDPRFATNEDRVRNGLELRSAMEAIIAELSRTELIGLLELADVPYGSLNDVADLLTHPQLSERDRWLEVDTPSGPAIAVRSPLDFGTMRAGMGRSRVPALGEDTSALLRDLEGMGA
jgi:itaconate CoA-transferase